MSKKKSFKSHLPLSFLTVLLICSLSLPASAGAYSARWASETVTGYGAAAYPQPSYRGSSPTASVSFSTPPGIAVAPPASYSSISSALPAQGLYSFSGSAYGLARSPLQPFYNRTEPYRPLNPAAPPVKPESPEQPGAPVKPDPAEIPTKPADPPSPAAPQHPPASENETALNAQEQQLFEMVNRERLGRGLAPLQLDPQLTYLARLKSRDMADLGYFAHQSPSYGNSGEMLRNAGVKFTLAAENIGVGGSISTIFNAFMNSSGHRNKIVDSRYSRTGIGVIYKPGRGYLVTQLFLSPRQ